MTRWTLLTILSATALMAQSEIRPDLDRLQYPALARSARIQGSVKFKVTSGEVMLVSGHPMLAQTAKDNLARRVGTAAGQCLLADYNFSFPDDFPGRPLDSVVFEEPIGNGFERFFLRLVHRPVTKKTRQYFYPPPVQKVAYLIKPAENGCPVVEIDVQSGPTYVQW